MTILRATAVLEMASGIDKDAARNVWHFATSGDNGLITTGNIADGLRAFYGRLAEFLSPTVERLGEAHRIEVAAVTPGGPGEADDTVSKLIRTHTMALPGINANAMGVPPEVAVVMSFAGELDGIPEEAGVIRPASRRRGRLYLGPFNTTALAKEQTTNTIIVAPALRTAIIEAYNLALAEWGSGPTNPQNVQHVVYSRQAALHHLVKQVWVNGEFDTVRRRGVKSVLREQDGVEQPPLV